MSATIARTLIATVEDRPSVLARVVSLLRRRGYSIDSLTVGPTEQPVISQVTLVVRLDEDGARRLIANLYKLVEVVDVEDVTLSSAAIREMVLMKVKSSAETRAAVRALCDACSARLIEDGGQTLSLEVTGTRAEVDAAVEAMRPRGIIRLVRTGAVALSPVSDDREPGSERAVVPGGMRSSALSGSELSSVGSAT